MKAIHHPESILGGFSHEIFGLGIALGFFALAAAQVKKVFGKEKPDAKKQS